MMMGKGIGMLAVVAGLGACTTTDDAVAGRGTCRPQGAAALVGKPAPDDATILKRTGSTLLRRIAPGDATTKDYRINRVTVTVADEQVVAASCG